MSLYRNVDLYINPLLLMQAHALNTNIRSICHPMPCVSIIKYHTNIFITINYIKSH